MSPPRPWSISTRRRGLRHQERALGHHVVLEVPVRSAGLEQRLGQGQAGVVHDQVEPAEREHGRVDHRLDGVLVGHVGRDADRHVRAADLGGGGLRLPEIEVGDHDAGALGREPLGGRLADAAGGAGHQGDPGGERLRRGHPLELGLLERPVLDPELLRLVDRGVRREALGAAHHVDRVDVELAGDAGGLLVRAVREHADARHQDDQRVGAAHRGRPLDLVAVVVAGVVGAVGLVQLGDAGLDLLQRRVGRAGRRPSA